MSKRVLKSKRRRKALPALGIAGVSLALASGASASTGEATTNIPSISQSHEIFLGEEEIFDVSLATFYVFDKEVVDTATAAPIGIAPATATASATSTAYEATAASAASTATGQS